MLLYWLAELAFAAAAPLEQSVFARTRCVNPSVRREWRRMPPHERAGWINAVKCLNTLPHNASLVPTHDITYSGMPPINTSSSHFDDWIYVHMDLNPIMHHTGYFFPWHRAYLKDFEIALQQKCGYEGTQPYWDWTLDASNFEDSTFWDPNPVSGVGGWGDPNDDYQITDGGFAGFPLSYPSPHTLRRRYSPISPNRSEPLADTFTPARTMAMVNDFAGTFVGFQAFFEPGPHGSIHYIVGGDFQGSCPSTAPANCMPGPTWTPNDPLFMMHHAMVDKLWNDWQHANPANFWSFGGGSVSAAQGFEPDATFPTGLPPYVNFSTPIPTDGILNEYTVYELMDIRNERLCYVYE